MQAILLRLFVEIDFLIHQGVSEVLKLIFRIADTEIFSEGSIATFTSRVYGVLGVLILFKIIISAIQYLINPDKMTDKDKGFGGLLSRTIISVAMLALVPTIFDFARLAQDKISVAIPQIVLGMKIDNTSDIQAIGDNMSWVTVKAFVSAKEGKNTSSYPMESLENFKDNVTQGCGWLWADENCIYDYNFFFSIIVGVFMLYILLSMAIDVAIRTIKFGLIEILAPIPIASYINNQENFKSWYQNAFKVYADLFIRFIIIYFIIFVIVTLTEGKITIKSSGEVVSVLSDPFLYVFLIVGLLMFAKQAPKFISDLLGLKSDGMGGIADMFKPAWSRAGALAAPLAGVAAGVGSYRSKRQWGAGVFSSTASALRSAASATTGGLKSAINGDKASDVFKNSRDKARAAADKRFEFVGRNGGFGIKGKKPREIIDTAFDRARVRGKESFDTFSGITTGAEQISRDKTFYQNLLSLKSNEKKNNLAKTNALGGFVDNSLTIAGSSEIRLENGNTYTNASEFFREYNELAKLENRNAEQQSRFIELNNDKHAVEKISSTITLSNGNAYGSYAEFLSEYEGFQNIPYEQLNDKQKQRYLQLRSDKDAVEKFMIRNESFIALTNPSKDEGNYSAIAADVIQIARSGSKDKVDAFLRNIGGGQKGDEKVGASILTKLTNHEALSRDEAIKLNNYIAGNLESDAQKGISIATATERTVPKG